MGAVPYEGPSFLAEECPSLEVVPLHSIPVVGEEQPRVVRTQALLPSTPQEMEAEGPGPVDDRESCVR